MDKSGVIIEIKNFYDLTAMLFIKNSKSFLKIFSSIIAFITPTAILLILSLTGVLNAAENSALKQHSNILKTDSSQSLSSRKDINAPRLASRKSFRENIVKSALGITEPQNFPLHEAAMKNEWQTIQNLLAEGADIDAFDYQLDTPLVTAIFFGHDDLARQLVSAGAKVNPPTKRVTADQYHPRNPEKKIGQISISPTSPLRAAFMAKNEAMALFLFQKGANLTEDEKSGYGKHPIMRYAFENNFFGLADEILRSMESEQRKGTINDLMPLAAQFSKGGELLSSYLLDHGARLESFDKEGRTPLMLAALEGNLDLVTYLLDHGAIIDSPSSPGKTYPRFKGYTALMFAASRITFAPPNQLKPPQILVVKYLLEHGADVNHQGSDKKTTLHLLSSKNTPLELIDISFEHGAKPNVKDALGYTPFKYALYSKRIDIAQLLMEKGADIGINISEYIQSDNDVAVDFLIANHYDLNKEYKSNTPMYQTNIPLIVACEKGKTEYVKKFIDAGADVNIANSHGITPLYSAVTSGNLEIVKILVDAGAELNYKGRGRVNPYLHACYEGQKEIAAYLKSKGAVTGGWIYNPIGLGLLKIAGLFSEEVMVIDEIKQVLEECRSQ